MKNINGKIIRIYDLECRGKLLSIQKEASKDSEPYKELMNITSNARSLLISKYLEFSKNGKIIEKDAEVCGEFLLCCNYVLPNETYWGLGFLRAERLINSLKNVQPNDENLKKYEFDLYVGENAKVKYISSLKQLMKEYGVDGPLMVDWSSEKDHVDLVVVCGENLIVLNQESISFIVNRRFEFELFATR